jgi:hypothetical protein
MAKSTVFAYTGHKTPVAGQYVPSGGKGEYTLARGDIVPPNRQSDLQRFILVDRSKRK